MSRTLREITRQAVDPRPEMTGEVNHMPQDQMIPEGEMAEQPFGDPGFGGMGMVDPGMQPQPGAAPQMEPQESPWRDRSIEIPEIVVQPPRRR